MCLNFGDPEVLLKVNGLPLTSHDSAQLPATITLDYPSISALAGFIASLMGPVGGGRKPRLWRRPKGGRTAVGKQAIDVVGASCVYPGGRRARQWWMCPLSPGEAWQTRQVALTCVCSSDSEESHDCQETPPPSPPTRPTPTRATPAHLSAGAKDATNLEAMFSATAGATDIPRLTPFERPGALRGPVATPLS